MLYGEWDKVKGCLVETESSLKARVAEKTRETDAMVEEIRTFREEMNRIANDFQRKKEISERIEGHLKRLDIFILVISTLSES